ncbi:MAG: formyltetrahydrofolate deformylase [Acidobacteria bacterium]|nr:formyltetrahydrofolate deformylase [Acidobacteriota bacterium]
MPETDSVFETAVLLVDCPDRKGILAAIADFIYLHGGNVLHADQHQDNKRGLFFMRIEWDLKDFDLDRKSFQEQFEPIARDFQIDWQLELSRDIPSVAIFVSKYQHCLVDLLYRHQIGELKCKIPLIISNHPDAQVVAGHYGIPYHHVPVEKGHKQEAESAQVELLRQHSVDLVVLARYMQVLSGDFVSAYPRRIINVHHSFLPAFSGAQPYRAAFERGVKLIGATSHYVTEVLDDGPIIEQDVVRISHRDQVEDLTQKGRDLERMVLARAVRWHLDHRILCYGNKSVIFD